MHKQTFLTRTPLAALLVGLILAGAALAADITGNWTGTMAMGDQQFNLAYTFKQDGEKLTGTMTGPQGDPMTLNDGKVVGDKISFTMKFDGPNGAMTISSQGTIKGEEITMTSKMEGADGFPEMPPVTLKRAK